MSSTSQRAGRGAPTFTCSSKFIGTDWKLPYNPPCLLLNLLISCTLLIWLPCQPPWAGTALWGQLLPNTWETPSAQPGGT